MLNPLGKGTKPTSGMRHRQNGTEHTDSASYRASRVSRDRPATDTAIHRRISVRQPLNDSALPVEQEQRAPLRSARVPRAMTTSSPPNAQNSRAVATARGRTSSTPSSSGNRIATRQPALRTHRSTTSALAPAIAQNGRSEAPTVVGRAASQIATRPSAPLSRPGSAVPMRSLQNTGSRPAAKNYPRKEIGTASPAQRSPDASSKPRAMNRDPAPTNTAVLPPRKAPATGSSRISPRTPSTPSPVAALRRRSLRSTSNEQAASQDPRSAETCTGKNLPMPNHGTHLLAGIPCIISDIDDRVPRFEALARYLGTLHGADGDWVGVVVSDSIVQKYGLDLEWTDGKHDGGECITMHKW